MQPFQVPRPGAIPGGNRPGPPGRIPGPQPGARPGVPRPGMPNPMGVKPQIPSNIGVNSPGVRPVQQEEKPQEPVENIQPEPVHEEVKEQKPEPVKTEAPVKQNRPGPPQFGQKPMPKPGMPGMPGVKPGPPFGQPQPVTRQPEPISKQPEIPQTKKVEPELAPQRKPSFKAEIEPPQQRPQEVEHREQIPQRKPSYKQEVEPPVPQRKVSAEVREPTPQFKQPPPVQAQPQVQTQTQGGPNDSSSDRLLRLSESLQAMKDLRSNFQGFNAEEEEQEEEQYAEDEGEGEEYAEEDDYVRVEDTEGEEGQGDNGNEGLRYSDENQDEEYEDNQNQDYEEEYEPESQGQSQTQIAATSESQYPQIIEEETPEETPVASKNKASLQISPERKPISKLPPPMVKTIVQPSVPVGSAGLRAPESAGNKQFVGSAGIKPQSAGLIKKPDTPGMRSPFSEDKGVVHHHQPHNKSKYATESQELLTSHEGHYESGKKDSDYERIGISSLKEFVINLLKKSLKVPEMILI